MAIQVDGIRITGKRGNIGIAAEDPLRSGLDLNIYFSLVIRVDRALII